MITDQNILNDLLEWYTENWYFNSNMANMARATKNERRSNLFER